MRIKVPPRILDIQQYVAQDLAVAEFLKIYTENPSMGPQEPKAKACERWSGNSVVTGISKPRDKNNTLILCSLAHMYLFFSHKPKPHPTYTFDEAMKRYKPASDSGNPCCNRIKPSDRP